MGCSVCSDEQYLPETDLGFRYRSDPYDALVTLAGERTLGMLRLVEATETIESHQLPDGRLPLDVRHKDTLYEEIAGAPGEPNRWITLRALRRLRQ